MKKILAIFIITMLFSITGNAFSAEDNPADIAAAAHEKAVEHYKQAAQSIRDGNAAAAKSHAIAAVQAARYACKKSEEATAAINN
jgi:hypothetical protein